MAAIYRHYHCDEKCRFWRLIESLNTHLLICAVGQETRNHIRPKESCGLGSMWYDCMNKCYAKLEILFLQEVQHFQI